MCEFEGPIPEASDEALEALVRLEEENARLSRECVRLQRLEHLGEIAARIAHDLNNVLGSLGMALELLDRTQMSEDDRTLVETMEQTLLMGSGSLREVLDFVRDEDSRPTTTRLADALVVARLVRRTLPAAIRIDVTMPPGPMPRMRIPPADLQQVLLNLLLNARDAMGEAGGTIRLTCAQVGATVRIEVHDDGSGMDPEVCERATEPLFTTKPTGTGLGLYSCTQLVERAGGQLTLSSEPGVGTRVVLELPAV